MSDPSSQAALAGTEARESADISVPTQRGPGTGPQAGGTLFAGRSPGRLAWMRLRRDRTALVSGVVLVVLIVLGRRRQKRARARAAEQRAEQFKQR